MIRRVKKWEDLIATEPMRDVLNDEFRTESGEFFNNSMKTYCGKEIEVSKCEGVRRYDWNGVQIGYTWKEIWFEKEDEIIEF